MARWGIGAQEPAWVLAVLACLAAVWRARLAARRIWARADVWTAAAGSALFGGLASLFGVADAAVGTGVTGAFYVGFAGSLLLLVAVGLLARANLPGARVEQLADALLLGTLVIALGGYFVAIPGFRHGDPLLTLVFLVDISAVVLGALATLGGPGGAARRAGWTLVAGCTTAAVGDGLTSAASAGQVRNLVTLTALLWAATGGALAVAASTDDGAFEPAPDHASPRRWLVVRIVLPAAAVLALPAAAGAVALHEALKGWEVAYFAGFFVFALVLTFGRQALLLLENRLAVNTERELREQVMRRNEELEALTRLASTMTETLEETPIIERGLDVLRLAARTTSSALYLQEGEVLVLVATTGDWEAGGASPDGGRQVIRLPLTARGRSLGEVVLVRPGSDEVDEPEQKLLHLLADQLAIALQNARDYREKLEQAIRDPLTGLLNHRAFQERLGAELARARRAGYELALVALDVDHFKPINDRCGHAVGDQALVVLARTLATSLRSTDVAGRVGGDEFMIALPEANLAQAQTVVSRLRTELSNVSVGPTREALTISAGIAMYPRAAEYQTDLMRFADGAMYWSKSSGRDRVSVYSPDSSEALSPEEKAEHAQRASLVRTVHALARAVDAKDGYTHLHSQRVAFYAVTLAISLGIDSERVEMIRTAGVLHDVGKIGITDGILLKPGALTEIEFAEMRRHSELGRDIVAGAGMTEIADWVCHLHERWDGRGYPHGLAGEEIPIESRILAAADALEAMTYPRVYRPALTLEVALGELENGAGSQFDPAVAERLVELVTSGELQVGNAGLDRLELAG